MKLETYPDRDILMLDLADVIASELRSALDHEDTVTLAVPGGTTPGPIFDALSAVHMDWERVNVVLTDERWVPETSDRSNTRLIRERLLTGQAAAARYIPLYADTPEPEASMDALSEQVRQVLPINVLLLGMGADMHTASLFPGADRLEDALANDAPALMPMRAPGAPEPRITLTAPVLKGALSTHVLITGAEKRAAVEKAHSLHDPLKAPISVVLGEATVHWAE